MSNFSKELKIIPRTAWLVGLLLSFGLVLVMVLGPLRYDREMVTWVTGLKALFAVGVSLPPLLYVLLIGYVHADAKRRGMRYVMWTWLALVPYFIGVAAYFILRDPLPSPCPNCQTVSPARFAFCPRCGTALRPNCPQCGKPVERSWSNCAYCGVGLPAPGNQKLETQS